MPPQPRPVGILLVALCLSAGLTAAVSGQLVVDFSSTSPTGTNPLEVTFTGSVADGSVLGWEWDLGDGTTVTLSTPSVSHTYTAPGTYSVSLTAFSGQQSGTTTQADLVTVEPAVFAADFEASVTSGVQPLTAAFTDTTVAEVVTGWLWDFGDGATSAEQHPTHVYEVAEATTFSVSLTVFVGQQQDTLVRTDLVSVDPAPLVAAIDADATVGFGTFEVAFHDASQGGETTAWLWDFGDGATSTERDPVHTYELVGETTHHDVSLAVAIGPQEEQVTIEGFITQHPALLRRDMLLEDEPIGVGGADFNGDGRQDLLIVRRPGEDTVIAWLEGLDGEESFGPERVIYSVPDFIWPHLVDFDADGDPDLYMDSGVPEPFWLVNTDGAGTFSGPQLTGLGVSGWEKFRDVDGDGAVDVLIVQNGLVGWLENDGAGNFSAWAALSPEPVNPFGVELGDLSGDGHPDLLVSVGQSIGWMENTGEPPTFGPFQVIATVGEAQGGQASAADINGDGKADLFVFANFWFGWYENLGDGSFGPRQLAHVGGLTAERLLDVDLDGDPDVIASRQNSPGLEIGWFENLGGTFAERVPLVVPEASSALNSLTDIDGDGDQDILSAISESDTLVIQENRIGFDTWRGLGEGLAGATGVPDLEASGELAPGDTVTLSLRRALPGSSAYLVLGLSAVDAPFKGGVLVPSPDVLLAGLPVDADGRLVLDLPWPLGVPGDVSLYFQYWIVDEAAPAGLSSSNGLEGVTKP